VGALNAGLSPDLFQSKRRESGTCACNEVASRINSDVSM
jgi:hypothetical protein